MQEINARQNCKVKEKIGGLKFFEKILRKKSVRPPPPDMKIGVTLPIESKNENNAQQKYEGGGFAYIRRGQVPDRKKEQMIKITKCKVRKKAVKSFVVLLKHESEVVRRFLPATRLLKFKMPAYTGGQ